jgi:nucleoredoxin
MTDIYDASATWEILFGKNLLVKNGSAQPQLQATGAWLRNKTVLVYFSAHWCPPCRRFTPELVKFYNDLLLKRTDFEIIFASSDRSEEDFNECTRVN